jgi:DNA adenine methylase
MARPFIKWAGGKTQLLPELIGRIPDRFGRYYEPFIGSAALFFQLHALGKLPHGAVLSDANAELIAVYGVVRDDVEALIAALREHARHALDPQYFYAVRAWDREAGWSERTALERAARMIFLNKTCYNGLHRVNRRGEFNVPFGRYPKPQVCDEPNLRAASRALRNVDLRVGDFADVLDRADAGDLLYFDPPYVPTSATASFTAYTSDVFDAAQHARLASVFAALVDRGCTVLLSNSHTPLVHDLYRNFPIFEVSARRAINSAAAKRGLVREVIVTNPIHTGGSGFGARQS